MCYSAVDKTFGESAPRVGFFYNFKKSEFLIKQWDVEKEDISTEGTFFIDTLLKYKKQEIILI